MAKVIYEFDPIEDKNALTIVQNADKFYMALCNVSYLIRSVRKEYEEHTVDSICDSLGEILSESNYHEVL